MIVKKILLPVFLIVFTVSLSAQSNLPQINYVLNRISCGDISSFYRKLFSLKIVDSGTVNIVHIGDSHIQADFLTGTLRKGLQQLFGNAGRGLVFPYQLARSNAPADINSSSNTGWEFSRLASADQQIPEGIAGFCIRTNRSGATINLNLKAVDGKEQSFKKCKFFIEDNVAAGWNLTTGANSNSLSLENESNDSSLYREVKLATAANSLSLSLSSDTMRSFYGVSLETGDRGIIYHSIGVNGAKYHQYNETPLFWQQLPALKADIFIVSMGTNEAQANSFNESEFVAEVTLFLQKLKIASPNAAILITTAPDSYRGNRSNRVLQQLNASLYAYCARNNIALWDIYRVANGYGAAKNWLRKGLMTHDRIHFTPKGYQLQGDLLLNVLVNGYNKFKSNY
jgi:lysophospholipase L1-like esterase